MGNAHTSKKFQLRRWRSGKRAGLQNLYSRVQFPPGAPGIHRQHIVDSVIVDESDVTEL